MARDVIFAVRSCSRIDGSLKIAQNFFISQKRTDDPYEKSLMQQMPLSVLYP